MKAYIGEIVESNYLPTPEQNRAGTPYPRHYARVKMLWLATPQNPDPITPHPIPVFINQQHRDGRLDWQPLKPGTRVVVAEVNLSHHQPTSLAVIALGPQNTDDLYSDLRETAEYHSWPGSGGQDKYVDAPEDEVFGPNEDVGRTHLDGRGYGWQTRHPWPNDSQRDVKTTLAPGTVMTEEKRLDQSVVKREVVHTGPTATYTWLFDSVAGQVTLSDDKGNSVVMDSAALTMLFTAVASIGFDTAAMGFFGETPVAKPTVTGSKTATDGNPVAALTSLLAALASLGLITDSTT